MTRNKLTLGMGALLTLVSVGLPALAETKTEEQDDGYSYFFDEDALDSAVTSPYGSWFKLRPPVARVMLIRPRTRYILEILASAERL